MRVERPRPVAFPVETTGLSVESVPVDSLLASMPLERRLWLFPLVLVGFRLLVQFTGTTGLAASAIVMSALGFLIGAVLGSRGGGPLDVAASAFAGAVGGLLASALGFAAIRSVETAAISTSSVPTLMIVWGLIGAALGAASWVVFPRRKPVQTEARP